MLGEATSGRRFREAFQELADFHEGNHYAGRDVEKRHRRQ